MELFISPKGKDSWSGRLATPKADGSDGPLKTLAAARDRVRSLREIRETYNIRQDFFGHQGLAGPVTVYLRGGVYPITEPVVFGPQDSFPVSFKAFRGEKPIVDGGVRITGWEKQEINGRQAWVATLPEVASGKWHFRELFVNGRRAERPRLPHKGLYRMKEVPGMPVPTGWGPGGYTKFICEDGHVRDFRNLSDVEVVYVHFWIEERSPIASFDPTTNLVAMSRPSATPLVASWGSQLADYYLDNIFEALELPGQWYLDRSDGRLIYLPRRGEDPRTTEVYAPVCQQLLVFAGDVEGGKFVENIHFEGITFRHTDWRHPSCDGEKIVLPPGASKERVARWYHRGEKAAASQAASDVPGVVAFHAARQCGLEDCTIEHVGWYGVEIGEGCSNLRLVGNTIRDMGAGGVRINGAAARDNAEHRRCGRLLISDNEITQGGRIFHSAVGVLSMNAHHVVIRHNHIHDLFYSGVSVGWEWGYHASTSHDNLIEANHIHDIGHALLSDMGGIYTLGVQPGTVLRRNLIHDVRSAHYGGWCIYPDEGSSHILIEHNVCYDADRQPFHQHYGRENIVRNNIWAFGGESVAIYSRTEPHRGMTFLRNIFVSDGKPMMISHFEAEKDPRRMTSDLNLFWDSSGKVTFRHGRGKKAVFLSLKQRQKLGLDKNSLIADPKFRDIKKRDFHLAENSPAWKLGFEAIDLSDVGPRPKSKREEA